MDISTGKLSFIFVIAVALSFLGAWGVAWRYRVALERLMRAGTAPSAQPASGVRDMPAVAEADLRSSLPAAAITLADNRRAAWRLSGLLIGLSLLMAGRAGWLQLREVPGVAITPHRLALMSWLQLWPLIPALGVAWRWPRWQVLAAILGWLLFSFALVMWRSTEAQSAAEVAGWLAFSVGIPAVLVWLLCLGGDTRAVAPWLLPPFIGLVWASILGTDLLAWFVAQRPGWLLAVAGSLDPRLVMALFALVPWLIAWWPMRWLARALAAAYAKKQLSELMVLFTAIWGVQLILMALSAASSMGWAGAVMLLPLLWIPLAMSVLRYVSSGPAARPPTLLVLRVFQHDTSTKRLFDDVIERWRLSGNTVLIAGTDLVDRTLDADDIFSFLDRQLPARFIRSEAEVAQRIDGFDLARDLDGRHRINECYCHDATWKSALAALVQRSDVALMDLRGFQTHNQGCRHELGALARSTRLARVVLLTDAGTDRAAALAAAEGAPAGRFVWIEAAPTGRAQRRQVLEALFAAGPPPQPASATAPRRLA